MTSPKNNASTISYITLSPLNNKPCTHLEEVEVRRLEKVK